MPAREPKPIPAPVSKLKLPKDNHSSYGPTQAERFVRLLGCWSFVNPTDAAKRRDPAEYKSLLRKLIEVNNSRLDNVGFAETAAAKRELVALEANSPTNPHP
jgi:hypothetical protein